MPRGAGPKHEREYKELKGEFQREGSYKGREEDAASRLANKQRTQFGETNDAKTGERRGKSHPINLPIESYEALTIPQIIALIDSLTNKDLKKIKNFESAHKNRKTLLEKLDEKICSR